MPLNDMICHHLHNFPPEFESDCNGRCNVRNTISYVKSTAWYKCVQLTAKATTKNKKDFFRLCCGCV